MTVDWTLSLLQALIIAAGNCAGIAFASWLFIDRKIDKKIMKYWKQVRNSSEGQDSIEILKETRKLLQSSEIKNVLNEIKEVVSDVRVIVKKTKERLEAPPLEEDEEEVELPTL